MNTFLKNTLAALLCLLVSIPLQAQQMTIQGTVTDDAGEPMPGVTITADGSASGTITDVNGTYTLSLSSKANALTFSFLGYISQTVNIDGQKTINVRLKEDLMKLDEVVVIGYGQQKKSDLSGAIVNVGVDKLADVASPNLVSTLGGRLAGVTVQQNGGGPTPTTTIRIRGTGTLNDNNPLIVIDDIIGADLESVNPTDIETMTVLKDASAAAIYGSRGASGVVIIKTKRGTANMKPTVKFDAYYGFATPSKKLNMLTASQLATIYNEASDNDGTPRLEDFTNPSAMKDVTDWQDEVFRTAPMQSYNISLSGGGNNNNYNLSFTAQNTDGILLNTYNKRYTLRINSDYKLGKRFKFGESINLSFKQRRGVDTRGDNVGAIIHTLAYHPDVPVYNEDGTYHGVPSTNYGDLRNPVGIFKRNTQRYRYFQMEGNMYLQYEILPGLSAKISGSLKVIDNDQKTFNVREPEPGKPNLVNGLTMLRAMNIGWIGEGFLYYDKIFNKKHKVNAMLGYSAMKNTAEDFSASKSEFDFEYPTFQYLNAGTLNPVCYGGYGEDALMSVLFRANYSYADKYIASFNMRADGSSKFAKGNRWGYFPSFSAAWRMSQEAFMKDLTWLDDLKLRVSYGSLGNQSVASYAYMATYTTSLPDGRYTFGPGTQTLYQGYYAGVMANPDLKWETTTQANVGIDASLFKNKLLLTLDYYNKKTKDILINPPALGAYGSIGNQLINGATVKNHGFEATIEYRDRIRDFSYDVSFNISTYRNKVTSLGNNAQPIYGPKFRDAYSITRTDVGNPIGYFYGYKTAGIFKSEAEVEAYTNSKGELYQPLAQPGDFRFEDVNKDGVLDADDRTKIGDAVPDFSYGLNIDLAYKGFDLNVFMQGVQGTDIWNAIRYTFGFVGLKYNYFEEVLGRWTPDNVNATVPRATWTDPNNNKRPSDYYIEDGSYLRMKNISLGYTLPRPLTKRVGIEKVRFYVSAQNLFTITSYSGYDPELGIDTIGADLESNVDRGQYPQSRSYSVGVNVVF